MTSHLSIDVNILCYTGTWVKYHSMQFLNRQTITTIFKVACWTRDYSNSLLYMYIICIQRTLGPVQRYILAILFYALWFYCSQTCLNYLAFQSFDFKRVWWRLFQQRVVYTKFDISVFITFIFLFCHFTFNGKYIC